MSTPSLAATSADLLDAGRSTHCLNDRQGERLREASLQLCGLHCAACAASVESALRGVAGVHEVSVNAASQRAQVR
ncbi:MAG: cation transporter, partial [Burkholderiaceae bacterium]